MPGVYRTSLPIARLRGLGCKVSTVIGHDPRIGSLQYGITLPEGVTLPHDAASERGKARARVARDGRVIVEAIVYRPGIPTPRALASEAEHDAAALLTAVAEALTKNGAVR